MVNLCRKNNSEVFVLLIHEKEDLKRKLYFISLFLINKYYIYGIFL